MPLFSVETFLLRSTYIRFIFMLSNFLNRTKVLLTRNLNTFYGRLQIFILRKKLKPVISVSLDTRNVGNSSNKGSNYSELFVRLLHRRRVNQTCSIEKNSVVTIGLYILWGGTDTRV